MGVIEESMIKKERPQGSGATRSPGSVASVPSDVDEWSKRKQNKGRTVKTSVTGETIRTAGGGGRWTAGPSAEPIGTDGTDDAPKSSEKRTCPHIKTVRSSIIADEKWPTQGREGPKRDEQEARIEGARVVEAKTVTESSGASNDESGARIRSTSSDGPLIAPTQAGARAGGSRNAAAIGGAAAPGRAREAPSQSTDDFVDDGGDIYVVRATAIAVVDPGGVDEEEGGSGGGGGGGDGSRKGMVDDTCCRCSLACCECSILPSRSRWVLFGLVLVVVVVVMGALAAVGIFDSKGIPSANSSGTADAPRTPWPTNSSGGGDSGATYPTTTQSQSTSTTASPPSGSNLIAWRQVGQDIAPNTSEVVSMQSYGHAVSLSGSGDRIIIGSPDQGLVEEFEFVGDGDGDGGIWSFRSFHSAFQQTQPPHFGQSVAFALDGGSYAAGAPDSWYGIYGGNAGRVRVWQQQGAVPMGVINGTTSYERLGESISLSSDGRFLAIGSPAAGENEFMQLGKVAILEYDASSGWGGVGDDIVGTVPLGSFGQSVSLSSDGTVVAIGSKDAGIVSVFAYDGATNGWIRRGRDMKGGDGTGETVSLSAAGDRVAFGARSYRGNNGGYGAVHLYGYDTAQGGDWVEIGVLSGSEEVEQFGSSVSLSGSGNTLAVGSLQSVTVYEVSSDADGASQLSQIGEIRSDLSVSGECSAGCSVSLSYNPTKSGTRVAVGYKQLNLVRVFEA